MEELVQFDRGYFCARAVFKDGVCIHAAPIGIMIQKNAG